MGVPTGMYVKDSTTGKVLAGTNIVLAVIASFCNSLGWILGAFPLSRSELHTYLTPANGHLTPGMSSIVRSALSKDPHAVLVIMLVVNVLLAAGGWLVAVILALGMNRHTIYMFFVLVMSVLIMAGNLIPALLGKAAMDNWGCENITYGLDRTNPVENKAGLDGCNLMHASWLLMFIAAGLWGTTIPISTSMWLHSKLIRREG